MELKKVYASIAKTEELDDGTVKVWGYASSEAEDSDGETVTAEAMKAALPDYMKWANVREMHQAKAAGTAIEAEVQEDGRTWFGAHIIDSEAVKKVNAGVYKGFSIGGKVTGRDDLNKSIITGIKLVEVSLVDRPANPEAVFTVVKAEGIDGENAVDELAELLNKGEVTPQQLLDMVKAAKSGQDGDKLQKGMWSIQDFASVLATLGWICSDAQYEADWEGDNSPIPAQLRGWLAQGIEIFKAMAAEETAELLAGLKAAAGEIDVIELAHRGSDLAKAGAKFSKDAKDKLAKAHEAVKAASDHLASTGYDKSDDGDDADKFTGTDDLAKVVGELDIAKADLLKVATERDNLAKRVKELEAQPEPGKVKLHTVEKGSDIGNTQDTALKVEPVTGYDGQPSDAATLIKFLHQNGGVPAIPA